MSSNIYSIIAAYFANVFIEKIYELALERIRKPEDKTGRIHEDLRSAYTNVSDIYLRNLRTGVSSDGTPIMTVVLREIHTYYNQYLPAIAYSEFIEIMCQTFMPDRVYAKLGSEGSAHKQGTIIAVICKTVIKLRAWIVSEQGAELNLDSGWTERKTAIGEVWRDKCYEMLRDEVSKYSAIITAQILGVKIDPDNIGTVPKRVLDKAERAIKMLVYENAAIRKENAELIRMVNDCKSIITKLSAEKDDLTMRLGSGGRAGLGGNMGAGLGMGQNGGRVVNSGEAISAFVNQPDAGQLSPAVARQVAQIPAPARPNDIQSLGGGSRTNDASLLSSASNTQVLVPPVVAAATPRIPVQVVDSDEDIDFSDEDIVADVL